LEYVAECSHANGMLNQQDMVAVLTIRRECRQGHGVHTDSYPYDLQRVVGFLLEYPTLKGK